jgi:hypothetical protein
MSWFTELGEKTGRTDIWILLVVTITILFITPIFLMSIQVLTFDNIVYNSSLDIIKWILTGIFVDLGIYSFRGIKFKLNGTSNSPEDKGAV